MQNEKRKKVIVLGGDGYLGTALRKHLGNETDWEVYGFDNGLREKNVGTIGSKSLTPFKPDSAYLDICDYEALSSVFEEIQPDAVVHLAEQPSAPFSMKSVKHATETQRNNVVGTMNVLWAIKEKVPQCHLVKLGTAGEYPDWLYNNRIVPEGGRITVDYQGSGWIIPTPRYAGSWYHFSKLFDSFNIDYACKIWGIRATDLNQGIVYGHIEGTRFDTDYYFGTVINRFAVEAISGQPLTVYGTGEQERGFISIRNVVQAIKLVVENPPLEGEYNIIHQLTETHTIKSIAEKVAKITGAKISYLENPRSEMQKNSIKFEAEKLKEFGLKTISMDEELPRLLETVEKYKKEINVNVLFPTHRALWK